MSGPAVFFHVLRAAGVLGFVLLAAWPADLAAQGRVGNERYRKGAYEEAVSAYRKGLDALEDAAATARYGLQNNLGSALYRLGRFGDARQAFEGALSVAQGAPDRARAAYNAGNAAYAAGSFQDAAEYYRTALLHDPLSADARYNYEVARRRLDEEDPPEDGDERVEPSAFARELRARAGQLVAERRYGEAYTLMAEGMQKDPTVQAYQDFIQRTHDVATIAGQIP